MALPEQSTEEINPREIVYAYLERERNTWLTAPSGSERMAAYEKINNLLDELGSLGVAQVVENPSGS